MASILVLKHLEYYAHRHNNLDLIGRYCFLWKHARILQSRNLWHWLNAVFNRVDPERIKEVGPDRAAAEWLLRCGAAVRWKDFEKWQVDYNLLPGGNFEKYKIEAVDATDSCVMDIGFEHLAGLKYVVSMKFHNCSYLEDVALSKLNYVQDSLKHLQISRCGNVTDKGIMHLQSLKLLETLYLFELQEIRDEQGCANLLQFALPKCNIILKDPSSGSLQSSNENSGAEKKEGGN